MLEAFIWLLVPYFVFVSIGTFGRIFHGILVDEKDPSKEKPVFVKTVKGKLALVFLRCNWLMHSITKDGSI